ncbi:hypothetical protein [Ectopseudomonas guguanensis]|uniref:Uncharacterized protein n=1 Tax=Ectopseudomonas guguanensis TaxID=1198456 RepID=A0A1H0XG95_9GAMM|nr:hypothetical protein [Pseudomonas guguanensis]SDQ01952.1 hypothetical protein SAMN05216213_115145 [Pseudomonas guguanensis]
MTKRGITLDAAKALSYIGQTVLLELMWEGDEETFWQCMHIVGVVLPVEGVQDEAYFLGMGIASSSRHANEIYFEDICSIRAMRYRDRHGSGNVLGRMTLTHSDGSRAALPARRNSFTVPANGSTGAAHP